MNKIDSIIIHCSATRAGQDLTEKDIDRMHRADLARLDIIMLFELMGQ